MPEPNAPDQDRQDAFPTTEHRTEITEKPLAVHLVQTAREISRRSREIASSLLDWPFAALLDEQSLQFGKRLELRGAFDGFFCDFLHLLVGAFELLR
jgi:hypothetical protein